MDIINKLEQFFSTGINNINSSDKNSNQNNSGLEEYIEMFPSVSNQYFNNKNIENLTEEFVNVAENIIQKGKNFTERMSDLGNSIGDGLNYTSEKTDYQFDTIVNVYMSNGETTVGDTLMNLLSNQLEDDAFLDFSHLKRDLKDIYNVIFATKDDRRATVDGINNYVEFATNKEYKKYLAPEDTLTQTATGIDTVQSCLDVCDYMNLGTTIGNSNLQDNWTCVSDGDQAEKNTETGFYGKVYANPETKELIIGFCGTNSLSDFGTDDVQMIKEEVPDQYKDALEFYNKYANDEQYKDYKITITGHSLGGSLAQLVGSTENVDAEVVSFSAFGTYNIQNKAGDDYNFVNNNDKIHNYITEYDIVGCATRHVGQTTLINSVSDGIVGNHMTSSIHNYLDEKRDAIS